MTPLLDVHTHSIISGHAYNTMSEMIAAAQAKGLRLYGITEHAASIPGTCHPIYFRNIHVVPRYYGDMRLLLGTEFNILDTKGTIDYDPFYHSKTEIRIAGIHSLCWEGGTIEENTEGMIAAIRNPHVQIIAHPGDGTTDLLFEPIVLAARDSGTLLEINNSSMKPARHKDTARDNNLEIMRLCRKYDVPVVFGSDAHVTCDIANYEYLYPMMEEVGFPDALVLNDKPEAFCRYIGIEP